MCPRVRARHHQMAAIRTRVAVSDRGAHGSSYRRDAIMEAGGTRQVTEARKASRWLAIGALYGALALVAFGPALRAPFDFDDLIAITANASIRRLWPLTDVLHPPSVASPVLGRPVVNLSFALNYAANRALGIVQAPADGGAREAFGYHLVGLLLHLVTALLLAAIIRATLARAPSLAAWSGHADLISVFAAGIWLVHPIQTEAVNYVTQRTELLASAFYLATLYAAIRAWPASDPPTNARASHGWSVVAIIACVLGLACKEILVTVPLMVVLYDAAFLAAPGRPAWRRPARRALYGALIVAATAGAVLSLTLSGGRGGTVGFTDDLPWYRYLYSQAWAIPHYVRLFFWPNALTFDYGLHPITGLVGVPGGIALVATAGFTIAAWTRPRYRWLGFLGAWFFLLLAPSSSVVPIRTEIAAERRVYLASAAFVVAVVVSAMWAWRWLCKHGLGAWPMSRRAISLGFTAALAGALLTTSARRSSMYDDLRAKWLDGIARTPRNGRAYTSLALAELRATPPDGAAADNWLQQAIAIDSTYIPAWVFAARVAESEGRLDDATLLLADALKVRPRNADATEELGKVLLARQRADLALPYLRAIVEIRPNVVALRRLGLAYLEIGRSDLAIAPLQRAVLADSGDAATRRDLGAALIKAGRGDEALEWLEQSARRDTSSLTRMLLEQARVLSRSSDSAVGARSAPKR